MVFEVLILVEIRNNEVKKLNKEILSFFCKKRKDIEYRVKAFIYGESISEQVYYDIGFYGVKEIISCESKIFNVHNPSQVGEIVIKIIENENPHLVVSGNTTNFRDVMPNVSEYFSSEMFSDVIDFSYDKEKITLTRAIYGGSILEKTCISNKLNFITIRPNVLGISHNKSVKPIVRLVEFDEAKKVKYYVKAQISKTDFQKPINEAEVIVAVGRGLKKIEDLEMIKDFAKTLGAVIGCTRPIVDLGFIRRANQIGQSGKSVSPKIIFTVGISGQIQFVAGISNAKTIISINNDLNATIFKSADYGITGDLYKIIPVLTEKLKEIDINIAI